MEIKWKQYLFAMDPRTSRKTKWKLLKLFSEEEILQMNEKEWKECLTPNEWIHFKKQMQHYNIEETRLEWESLRKKSINYVYHKEESYPKRLRNIPDPPLGLFMKGNWKEYEKSIAIVGARTSSSYGQEISYYFAKELSKQNASVVSGLAYGIDSKAHEGALDTNGYTCGVLGCGIDIVYPKENFVLYEEIEKKGCILSEYKPGERPDSWRFPERNRIISGLTDGVLVVEAKRKSGSLITADCALEQGRDVFAIPGRILDPMSEGCNWLIREGAKIVTEPSQILEDLYSNCENTENLIRKCDKVLACEEKLVYDCLSFDPKSMEQLICETNLGVSEIINIIFRLELKNYVKHVGNSFYIISI